MEDLDIENEAEEVEPETDEEETDEEVEPEEEVKVTIGDDGEEQEEEEPAPVWVKELRKTAKQVTKENKQLKQELEALKNPVPKDTPLREKPTLEKHDYDTGKFEQDLTQWFEEKRTQDDKRRKVEQEAEEQAQQWQNKLNAYASKRDELELPDFDDAEAEVLDALSQKQQGIVVQGADNPALVMYALGKNAKHLKALSEEKDLVKFAFAVAKLEKDLKMSKGKKPPAPEKRPTGSAPSTGGASQKALDRLMKEADKTGDYTKVYQYKRRLEAGN